MGLGRGTWAMVPKKWHFRNLPPILPVSQKRRTTVDCEHGDVAKTSHNIIFVWYAQ